MNYVLEWKLKIHNKGTRKKIKKSSNVKTTRRRRFILCLLFYDIVQSGKGEQLGESLYCLHASDESAVLWYRVVW